MRFSSILAIGAFIFPALASPLLDNSLNHNEVEAVSDIIDKITAVTTVAKRSEISSPSDVIEECQGLLISIKAHTAIINQTVVEVVDVATDVQISAIKVQLNIIVDLVKTLTIALGAVKGVIKFADVEVAKLVEIVVAIVLEIVCTLLYVIKCLNIKVLLSVILGNLCQVLAGLILVLEHIVGGVLALVLGCLNVPAILGLVTEVLASLIVSLTLGKVVY
jgi:hypothetical protein